MTRVAALVLFGFLCLALGSSLVAAQTATAALTLTDLPTTRVSTNDTLYVEKFKVELTLNNLVCPRPADLPITLAVTATPMGANATGGTNTTTDFSPATFHVDAGQYVVAPYRSSQDVTMTVHPASIPYSGLDLTMKVTASLAATALTGAGCQGQGTPAANAAAPPYTIHFARGTEPAPVTPTQEMPGAGLVLALTATAVGLGLTRRRA